MPSTTHASPDISARASELRFSIESHIEEAQDLSELVQFVASSVGDPTDPGLDLNTGSLLTDVEASARVMRAIARIHQEIFKDLLVVQTATGELCDCVARATGGAR
jgi:hypothetical protein